MADFVESQFRLANACWKKYGSIIARSWRPGREGATYRQVVAAGYLVEHRNKLYAHAMGLSRLLYGRKQLSGVTDRWKSDVQLIVDHIDGLGGGFALEAFMTRGAVWNIVGQTQMCRGKRARTGTLSCRPTWSRTRSRSAISSRSTATRGTRAPRRSTATTRAVLGDKSLWDPDTSEAADRLEEAHGHDESSCRAGAQMVRTKITKMIDAFSTMKSSSTFTASATSPRWRTLCPTGASRRRSP